MKRTRIAIAIVAAIVVPAMSVVAGYNRAISAVHQEIADVKLDAAKNLVTKEDLSELKLELRAVRASQETTAQDVARLLGMMERGRRSR